MTILKITVMNIILTTKFTKYHTAKEESVEEKEVHVRVSQNNATSSWSNDRIRDKPSERTGLTSHIQSGSELSIDHPHYKDLSK